MAARSRWVILGFLAVGLSCGVALAYYVGSGDNASLEADEDSPQWTAISQVDTANLTTVGQNPYINLEPGYQLRYTDRSVTRTITVRRKTKLVDGVQTRVIEEKDQKDGVPIKIVWKYYAIDKTSKAVYCFGVHVQSYDGGKLVGHRGWRSGAHGAVFTLAMPAAPKTGDALVRGHTLRSYEVVDTDATVVTPAGSFAHCLRAESRDADTSSPVVEKAFAPGVGLVRDGEFNLVKIARLEAKAKTDSTRPAAKP
jgi:hypothetical protein